MIELFILPVNWTEAGLVASIASKSVGQFTGNTDSQIGLYLIHVSKQPLNRPSQFASRLDMRFGRLSNRLEHIFAFFYLT